MKLKQAQMSKYDCNIRPYGQDLFIKKNTLYGQIWMTAVKISFDIMGRNDRISIFCHLIKFGRLVHKIRPFSFYLFGRPDYLNILT